MRKKEVIKISFGVIIFSLLILFIMYGNYFYYPRYSNSLPTLKYFMHDIATLTETYKFDYKTYPQTVQQLIDFSKTIPTEKDFFEKVNPYDKSKKIQLFDLSQPPDNNDEVLPDKNEAGNIFYYTEGTNYAIYAVGEDNKLLRNKGRIFYLSNQ